MTSPHHFHPTNGDPRILTASLPTSTSTTSAPGFAARRTNTTRRTSATSRSGKRGRNPTAQSDGIPRGDVAALAGTSSAPRCR